MSLTDNQNNIKPGDEWWRWRDSNDRLCRSHAWPPHTSDREMAATTTAARNCLAVRHALAWVSLGCQIIFCAYSACSSSSSLARLWRGHGGCTESMLEMWRCGTSAHCSVWGRCSPPSPPRHTGQAGRGIPRPLLSA